MSERKFLRYVGDKDFHDGTIVKVDQKPKELTVVIRAYSGTKYLVRFTGVSKVVSNRPEGMFLYALSEFEATGPMRAFTFANSEDEDDAQLDVEAASFSVVLIDSEDGPNQTMQRNAGSRPSSDDSPASETTSSPGPRG